MGWSGLTTGVKGQFEVQSCYAIKTAWPRGSALIAWKQALMSTMATENFTLMKTANENKHICYLSFKNNHILDIIICAGWVHISSPVESEINVHQIKVH